MIKLTQDLEYSLYDFFKRWYGVLDDVRGQQSRDSVEEDETYDVERSLRDSLEYQTESGSFLKDFILKENNKVNYTLFFPVLTF